MKSLSKVKTKKEERREEVYRLALEGDPAAMRTLRVEYGYLTIMVDGKPVDLKEI